MDLILAHSKPQGTAQTRVEGSIVVVHAVDCEEIRSARHPENREVEATLYNVGVHHNAGCGLSDVSEIIAGIRDLRNLFLVHGCGNVSILCLDKRPSSRHCDFAACFGNFERDVNRNRRPQQNIHRSALSAKTSMRHAQQVSGGSEEEESVHTFSVAFCCLGRPLAGVLDLDGRIANDCLALIGYDSGQTARGGGLSAELAR